MPFIPKSYQEIFDDMSAFLAANSSKLTDLNVGSKLYAVVRAVSSAITLGWIGLAEIRDLFYINSSSGTDLDRRISDFGMTRNPGAFATGSVLIYPSTTGLTVAAGDTIQTSSGEITFEILNSASIATPFTAVAVVASDLGYKYNMAAGTKLYSTSATNLTFVVGSSLDTLGFPTGTISGGVDVESDDDIKSRFVDYLKSLSRGTVLAIRQALRGTPGIGNVIVEEAKPVPGWITVTATDESGNLPSPLIEAIEQVLTDWGVAGMGYIIQPVIKTMYDVNLKVYMIEDPAVDKLDIETAIGSSLNTALNNITLGQSVYTSYINKIAFNEDYDIERVEIVSPAAPGLIAQPGELLGVDNITVTVIYV